MDNIWKLSTWPLYPVNFLGLFSWLGDWLQKSKVGLDGPWLFLDITKATVYTFQIQCIYLHNFQPHKLSSAHLEKEMKKSRQIKSLKIFLHIFFSPWNNNHGKSFKINQFRNWWEGLSLAYPSFS